MSLGTPQAALVLLATLLSLVVGATGIRASLRRGEWTRTSTATCALVLISTSVVNVVVALRDQWQTVIDAFGNTVIALPGWGVTLQRLLYVVLLVAALAIVARGLTRPGARINLPALLFCCLGGVSHLSALLAGDQPLQPFYLIPLLVLAAAAVTPGGLAAQLGIGTGCLVGAVSSGLAVTLVPSVSLLPCLPGACGIFGMNYRGVLVNQNALGIYLALALPFVYLAFGRRRGIWLGAYLVLLTLMTGSTAGAVAAVITYGVLLLADPDLRHAPDVRDLLFRVRRVGVGITLGAAASAGLLAPFLVTDPAALTDRGYLWLVARSRLDSLPHWLLGRGTMGWDHVREEGLIEFSATYSVHNQFLQMLFTAGLVGLVLFVAALVLLVAGAGRRYFLVVGCVLISALTVGIAERPWAVSFLDWLGWALPGALLCYPWQDSPQAETSLPAQAEPVVARV